MAKLSGISIADKNSNFDSGGAFSLQQKRSCNKVIQLDSGWEVELSSDCPYIVVRAIGLKEHDVTWATYEAAQEGLDLLSASGDADLSIHNSEKDRIIWWRDQSLRQFLRFTSILDYPFGFKSTSEMRDEFGNIITPETKYHSALRFVRLARLTSDLFDAYRNMYLALEFLTSSISKIGAATTKGKESELNWLKRVLTNSSTTYPKFQPLKENDVEEIYNIRCNIFHAKDEKKKLIPYRREDYLKVKEVFEKLEWAVLKLIGSMLNFNSSKSFYTLEAFKRMTERIFEDVDVLICNGNHQFYQECLDSKISICDLDEFLHKKIEKCTDLCEPNLVSYLATFKQIEVLANNKITGIIWKQTEQNGSQSLVGTAELESDLVLADIDFFEIHTGMVLNQ